MINLFKIKGQKREDAANANGRAPVKKQSAGELRLHKGLFAFEKWSFIVVAILAPYFFRINSILTSEISAFWDGSCKNFFL